MASPPHATDSTIRVRNRAGTLTAAEYYGQVTPGRPVAPSEIDDLVCYGNQFLVVAGAHDARARRRSIARSHCEINLAVARSSCDVGSSSTTTSASTARARATASL